MSAAGERSDRVGLIGYGCLSVLLLAGYAGGVALILLGIRAFLRATDLDVETTAEASRFLDSLEGSVVLCGAGTLAFLVGVVASVVLLKELSDDAARRRRGAIH